MPRNLKSVQQAADNLKAAASTVQQRYKQGVEGADWHTAASSDQSEANYNASMSRVLSNQSRLKGVRRVDNNVWRAGALNKGVANIVAGINNGIDKYRRNFGAVYEKVIPVVQGLPARTTDPAANVTNRVMPVVMAFHEHRLRGS